MVDIDECFEKFSEYKLMKDGRCEIHCTRGLWGVSAPTREQAEREARHYFIQYFEDGEYNR